MSIKIAIPRALLPPELPPEIAPAVDLINEAYPRIGKQITQLWGSAALQKYFVSLLIDSRGNRKGFPKYIITLLLRMYSYHDKLVSEDYKNAWGMATY